MQEPLFGRSKNAETENKQLEAERPKRFVKTFAKILCLLIYLIVIVFASVWFYRKIDAWIPEGDPRDWFVVNNMFVHDAKEGEVPTIDIDRQILKNFDGDWVAEVNSRGDSGYNMVVCQARGSNYYETTDVLKPKVDLNFWTFPVKCNLPAGKYVVKTNWFIKTSKNETLILRHQSNVFTITK